MSGGWNTIESDAGVFTYLLENLGVKGVQFEELLSLDPDSLAQLHPVYGVIFLFKFPTDAPYVASAPLDGKFDYDASQDIFFASQTIQNACGTQALLSVLLNKATSTTTTTTATQPPSSPSSTIDIGPHLKDFREFTMALPPEFRGEALSNSELIRSVHNSFARAAPFADETQRSPDDETEDAFHFIAYTSLNGTLYELDGLQPAPISHGPCGASDGSEFSQRVIEVLQRRIARYDATEIRFNLLAMTRDLREPARELGDAEGLQREEARRADWRFENALRKHNFVGFAGEALKGVVGMKLAEGGQGAYDAWVAEALQRRKAAHAARQGGGGGGDVDMSG